MSTESSECVIIDDCDLTDDEPGPSRMIHKPRACEFEASWFEQDYQKPSGQVIDSSISSEDISKYQNLIWNQPHDRMVPSYGLTPRELASIPSDGRKGWLVSSHFFWLSRCLNQLDNHAKCFVFDPHLRQEALNKLFPIVSRAQIRTLILVMCVGRQDDGIVFFGTDKIQGDHWSVTVIDIRDGTVYYCDTLGWPAPRNLTSSIVRYTRFLSLVHIKQLKIKLSHSANTELHSCTEECTNYPLQTCSDVCGVVVMICTTIAALDRKLFNLLMGPLDKNLNLYLTDPTEYSTYLRYVLMSWLAKGLIDMHKISLKLDFDPHRVPTPRALAKRTPMKRKFSTEVEFVESPRSFLKNFKLQKQLDALSKFILDGKKNGLSSHELLKEVLQFTTKSSRKKQLEELHLHKLCEQLSFNNAVERCQDPTASLKEYLNEFIQNVNNNPVILFKIPGKDLIGDNKLLDKNDFVLVLQTPYQKQLMETYGKQCICVDLSRKSEKFNISCNLTTISVFFDGIYEIPVAFLLSSSQEAQVVNVFFEAVRKNVGEIQTNIFIGDVQNNFFKQWVHFFPKPKKRMFSIWEVFQILHRQMRNSISDKDTVILCKDYLNVVKYITDDEAFYVYIEAFLVVTKQHAPSFNEYFHEKFFSQSRAEFWASCYRHAPQSKTIPFLKPFQDVLKVVGFFENGALNRTDVLFHKLMQLSIYLERRLIEISSEVKQASASRDIQRKHQHRSGNHEFYNSVSGDEWCIRASDDNNSITIFDTGIEDCDCVLKCDQCKICLHKYICSCSDYLLKPGACKHIHILHSIKKVNSVMNNEDDFASPGSKRSFKKTLDNGSVVDVDNLKSSVQKELVRLSDKIHRNTDVKELKCLLANLQDIEFPVS